MIFRIEGVMEINVVVEEFTAYSAVAEFVMHYCLRKRHN